jgi:hypothetical protein
MRLKNALGATLVVAGLLLAGPADAGLLHYTANLNASQVVDGVSTSTATGSALVTLDDSLYTVTTEVTWQGLSGPTDRSHLHFAPFGVSRTVADPTELFFHEVIDDPARTIPACDLVFTDCAPPTGSSIDVLQLAADNGYGAGPALGLATDTFADLILALNLGDIYIDMHTKLYPTGEIRGQLAAATVPEPSTLMLAALGFVAAFVRRART